MSTSLPAPVTDDSGEARADRYLQERMLGRGAMGAVYLVRDRDTGEQLALKKLFRIDGKTVLRLKREFRLLADVSHPNLAKVYELGRTNEGWFLAMEYVEGEGLQSYLDVLPTEEMSTLELASEMPHVRIDERMLNAFHQLASGVQALHRAGMLHRDLKPSNVIVSDQRVVVLDFGLARELDPKAASLTEEGVISGTPAYMAPEQALGQALSEASDWYAFGVMLYEALTGELPHAGSVYELMRAKLERDAVPPRELNPDVPLALNELCVALLARDPSARPPGTAVLELLASLPGPGRSATPPVASQLGARSERDRAPGTAPLIGRIDEVAKLWTALRAVSERRCVAVHVRGVSGAGKSALVEEFLGQVESDGTRSGRASALVLRSRCYEREAMPFKALDGVVDALGRHLARADDFDVSHLLPTDIAPLAQLFPVLERLRAVQRLLAVLPPRGDAVHDRQRAEGALRELFSRLSARRPVVIWIDDLQWGDLDSAAIIKGWLQRADLPVLLLLSYRADEVDTSECLRLLLRDGTDDATAAASDVLQLEPLPPEDIAQLCRLKLGARGHDALVTRIVGEAHGSPFLAEQLAALAAAKLSRGDRDVDAISISGLVAQVTELLPAPALQLLAVLAVAGRPLLPKLALRAAGIRHGGREVVHALRRLQLVRTRAVAGDSLLEVYHDRVREGVQRRLQPEQRVAIHAGLLAVMEYDGLADPDWLHALALGAGQQVAALRYGLAAGERATAALAFERAAELYTRCLELSAEHAEHRGELLRKLAAALGWCGRGAMAADAYLQAAQLAQGPDAVRLLRLAVSHLFRSGRFAEGELQLQRLLEAIQLRVPSTPAGMIRALVWQRARSAARGLRYKTRSESEIPAAVLARVDCFESLRYDTIGLDPLRGALFLAHQLRGALDAGEPMRVLRALAGAALFAASSGTPRADRRSATLLQQVSALAQQLGSPAARAAECTLRAVLAWSFGRPEQALEPAREAERLYRQLAPSTLEGVYHLRALVATTRQAALVELGHLRAFVADVSETQQEAHATDNHAVLLHVALNEVLHDEILGRAANAVVRLDRQRAMLPTDGFGLYSTLHMIAVLRAACASGELAWGVRYLEQDWPRYLRSPVRGLPKLAVLARLNRLQLLLSHHFAAGRAASQLPRAWRGELGELERACTRPANATSAAFLCARVEHAAGDTARAVARVRRAIERNPDGPETPGLSYQLGAMLGGAEGATLCADSRQAFLDLGIVDPDAWLRALYPELMAGK
jgi:predicted Ser/Thr protein kinase/tetratricopeptide (TPR) repeat protein